MARKIFLAAFLILAGLVVASEVDAGYRVDVLGWDPFGQKTTGWEIGLEVYATRDEAERYQEAVDQWPVVKQIRIVEVEEPPVEVKIPDEFLLVVPQVDENGNPIGDENVNTRAKFATVIDQIYANAREAKDWAFTYPEKLNAEAFNKVNALIEKYNFAVAKSNRSSRAPFAKMKLLTPVDVFAARTRKLLTTHQANHAATMRDLSESLAGLKTERDTLLETQRQLDARRSALARQEADTDANYKKKLAVITKGFADIDVILAKNPSDTELKSQGVEQRLESLRGERTKLETQNDDMKTTLKSKYDVWKKDYETLAKKFKDFNLRSRNVKAQLGDHKAKVESSTKAFVIMRESVQSYFGDQSFDEMGRAEFSDKIQNLLQSTK